MTGPRTPALSPSRSCSVRRSLVAVIDLPLGLGPVAAPRTYGERRYRPSSKSELASRAHDGEAGTDEDVRPILPDHEGGRGRRRPVDHSDLARPALRHDPLQ